jgi:hypothetical protein
MIMADPNRKALKIATNKKCFSSFCERIYVIIIKKTHGLEATVDFIAYNKSRTKHKLPASEVTLLSDHKVSVCHLFPARVLLASLALKHDKHLSEHYICEHERKCYMNIKKSLHQRIEESESVIEQSQTAAAS